MDFLTQFLNEGLLYSATSSACAEALAFMMARDYDDHYIATIVTKIWNIQAHIPRVRT
jgi:hypothetical protein